MWLNEIKVRSKSRQCWSVVALWTVFGGSLEFDREFHVVTLCSLACWPIACIDWLKSDKF